MLTLKTQALLGLAVALATGLSASAADPIDYKASGADLEGMILEVTYCDNTMMPGVIVAQGNDGYVLVPGFFEFLVEDDTFTNDWELTNHHPGQSIKSALFRRAASASLFDDSSNPSTPRSALGHEDATWKAGPAFSFCEEYVPWNDPENDGDMYEHEELVWDCGVFPPGETSAWRTDTDIETDFCPDFDDNGRVDFSDLLRVLSAWNTPTEGPGGNGFMDFDDLLIVLAAWGPCT